MPLQLLKLFNAIEQDTLSDEEYATLKRCVETRDRDAAQVTVTQVSTVQQCSSIPKTPEPPPDVCVNLENNEDEMDPGMEELTSSSTSTGLNTPGQLSPPNEGVWETGRIIADGILTAGVNSSQGGRTPSPPERATRMVTAADTPGTINKHENFWRHIFDSCYPRKPQTQDIQRTEQAVRPRWKRREGLALERGCTSTFLFLGWSCEASCLSGARLGGFVSVFPALCVCFSELVFFLSQVNLISKMFSRDANKWCTQPEDKRCLAYYPIWRWRGQAMPGLVVAQTL